VRAASRLLLFAAFVLATHAHARADGKLIFFTAASTADAVNEIATAYRRRASVHVTPVLAASGTLARQIANGAPADIFLSANPKWMEWLATRGLLAPGSRMDLLTNTLVLIQPLDEKSTLPLKQGFVGKLGDGRLAIGDPAYVPAGDYARAALRSLGLWQALAPRVARLPSARHVLAMIGRGEAKTGIVYASDAKASRRVRIADRFPTGAHPSIRYPLALLAGRDTPRARGLLAFLTSAEGCKIFARHGFGTVPAACSN
jgi:molybdate transport system substrate-binding protein